MSVVLPPPVRVFGADRGEIVDLESWLEHAPPVGGAADWRDGYTAKEQAKAWLRSGRPEVPSEFWSAIGALAGDAEELYATPEYTTRLDLSPAGRRHDLLVSLRSSGGASLVIGVEAKACEGFDGVVADWVSAREPNASRARCNLLARALFGRDVVDEPTGEILDDKLGRHGHLLWVAAVGTIIEAQARGLLYAVLVIHQFKPGDLAAAAVSGDRRGWAPALAVSASEVAVFASALEAAGSVSHQTAFVKAGTQIRVVNVESTFAIPA